MMLLWEIKIFLETHNVEVAWNCVLPTGLPSYWRPRNIAARKGRPMQSHQPTHALRIRLLPRSILPEDLQYKLLEHVALRPEPGHTGVFASLLWELHQVEGD